MMNYYLLLTRAKVENYVPCLLPLYTREMGIHIQTCRLKVKAYEKFTTVMASDFQDKAIFQPKLWNFVQFMEICSDMRKASLYAGGLEKPLGNSIG